MIAREINIPEIHAEVSAASYRYEQALVSNDVAVLDEFFHNRAGCVEAESPKTLNPALRSGETMKVSASERIMV